MEPALDGRLRGLLPEGPQEMGLAVRHLGAGQAALIHADRGWPSTELRQLVRRDDVPLAEGLFNIDAEQDGWLTTPPQLLDFMEAVYRATVASGAPSQEWLRGPRHTELLAGITTSDVVACLSSREGNVAHEAAVVRAPDGPDVTAVIGADPVRENLARIGSAVDECFRQSSWGTQDGDGSCW